MRKETNNWNLALLYKSDNDPNIAKEREKGIKANAEFVKKWGKDDSYLKDPAILLKAIVEYENMIANDNGYLSKEDLYYFLRTSEDSINTDLKAKESKHSERTTKLMNDTQFFTHKISKIPQSEQKKFLEYNPLSTYKHFLEKLFEQAKYLLTEQEEKLLLITSKTSHSNWVEMVEEFLYSDEREFSVERKKERMGFEKLLSIATVNKDEKVRDRAVKLVNDILLKHTLIATKELNSILQYKNRIDELRKITRPDQERLMEDDVDEEVVDTLIKTVSSRYDIPQKYYKLKAKLLGKKKLKYNERNLLVGSFNRKYKYEDARQLVLSTYRKIDENLYHLAKTFFDEKRIDVFPKKGKRGGGFCTISLVNDPVYILLNYTDEITDVTTLAHELGHGVNHIMMKENNTELNYTSSKSTAEVASTFFEDFTLEEITEGLSEEDRFTILLKKLDGDIGSIFRQIAMYQFEQELHMQSKEKGYLSEKEIGEIFLKHMKEYMGGGVSYEKGSENWWVYVNHFRLFFYVYSYASGLLISKSLQSMIKKDGKKIEVFKKFLREGGKQSPKNIFHDMGIDITSSKFWEEGITQIENLLSKVEQLAVKLGKI
ncbi:hypothetical protein HYV12_02785 [Candidatus Dojkabacteria bacterium]|nr:hypothetical protein [Candidatus Dojkabacteria bacterium]